MAGGKHILGKQKTQRVFGTAKVGDRGQIVIPKEARELFDLKPGMEILVLGDREKGIAILPKNRQDEVLQNIIAASEVLTE